MKKVYPCVEVDLSKITHNVIEIVAKCNEAHIEVTAVTKVFCSNIPVVKAILQGGVTHIADSRILNLKKLENINCDKMLLRIPMLSEVEDVVKYSNVSLNSEIETIKQLSSAAQALNKIHQIILMVDLGDLREGVLVKDVIYVASQLIKFTNIKLIGLGTNVTCYGGVIPDENNLGELIRLREEINKVYNLDLPIISGGNSSSLYMVLNKTIPKEITGLRIGEGIALGRETAYGKDIENCYQDAFVLKGQIIELKSKPTLPTGNLGMDAFGQKPHFEDKGIRKRAIIAVGRQDIRVEGLTPLDEKISIFGASSDHLIIDVTDSKKEYKLGDIVEFKIDYGCLLAAMTSVYIEKYYK